MRALEAAREALRRRPHAEIAAREGKAPDPLQLLARPRNVDALVAVAETALASETKERPGADRCQIVVHVDTDTLTTTDDDGRCQLDDGPAINAETARRLACDASVVRIVERDGKPLSVGRKTRTIPPALRRALRARDRSCRFPGCDNTRYLHAHHVRHWAHGGETSLDNLIHLCGPHHRLVHEGGYSVVRERNGQIGFRDRRGGPIPYAPPRLRGHPNGIIERNRREGLVIDGRTGKYGIGERMEFAYVADVFLGITRRRE